MGLVIASYFVLSYILHENFIDGLQYLQDTTPSFFDRYRYLILIFGIGRERVLFNTTFLNSMEFDPMYGQNLDYKYNDLSTDNE